MDEEPQQQSEELHQQPNEFGRVGPFKLADTEFIAKPYQNVFRLNYPCGELEDVRGPKGTPPTLEIIATILVRHREECEYGCT